MSRKPFTTLDDIEGLLGPVNAAQSWWTGDRVGLDRLALWLSYRIGAARRVARG